jgi:nucleoid-associated protein YgaU
LQTAASSASAEPAAPASRVTEYVIQPGDTLAKIAQTKLGGKSKSILDAILDLNRQRISDPNQIQSGSVLLLPRVAPSSQPSTVQRTALVDHTSSKKPAQSKSPPAAPAHDAGARWYQVRKNDRYMSIARAELGDASRWEEIHRLNKDKFPDPDQIREGVRIKLPGK